MTLSSLLLSLQSLSPHALYLTALDVVANGQVAVRKNRAAMLQCSSENDFLAKVYCVRLAFDHVLQSSEHRSYFIGIAKSLVSEFLSSAGEDSTKFCELFDGLVDFMSEESSWNIAVEELTARNVSQPNFVPGRAKYLWFEHFCNYLYNFKKKYLL